MSIINLNDLPEFRHDDENHELPMGAMVEVEFEKHMYEVNKQCFGMKGTMRGFIVGQHRDCDGTPLYTISMKPVELPESFINRFKYRSLISYYLSGYSEHSIKRIGEDIVPLESFESPSFL